MPYFLRHYQRFATSITVFDNQSTDRSREIMQAAGVTVHSFDTGGQMRDDIQMHLKNTCWQPTRQQADWIIVVDMDEFVYHPNLRYFLDCACYTVFRPFGYHMFCKTLPTPQDNLPETIRTGVADSFYNKACLFRPDCVDRINFGVGAHHALPVGPQVLPGDDPELKLLHYNYLTLDWTLARHAQRRERLSDLNIAKKWAVQYMQTPAEVIATYRKLESLARLVIEEKDDGKSEGTDPVTTTGNADSLAGS